MPSQKQSKRKKPQPKPPKAPPSIKEPPTVRYFAAVPENYAQRLSVDDLRRSVSGTSWSVNKKLDGTQPPPRYPLGGVSEGLTVLDASRRIDWPQLFSIPPQNPHLLQRAIQLKLLPAEIIALMPASPEEVSHSNLEHSIEQAPPKNQRKTAKTSRRFKAPRKGGKQ